MRRQTDPLQSHTVETGAQEIAAIILATALLARERARAANGQVPVLADRFRPSCTGEGRTHVKRWNQLDLTIKRTVRVGRFELHPAAEACNLFTSSVVLDQAQIFGPALGLQPILSRADS